MITGGGDGDADGGGGGDGEKMEEGVETEEEEEADSTPWRRAGGLEGEVGVLWWMVVRGGCDGGCA